MAGARLHKFSRFFHLQLYELILYSHLRCHSYYSFLRGLASPADLANAAAAHGMPSIGLTDRLGLTGAIEFYDACQAAGVSPILGLEIELAAPTLLTATPFASGALVLLAEDFQGWGSLCRLSSELLTNPEYASDPVLPFEHLSEYAAHVLCLTGGRAGLAGLLAAGGFTGEASSLLGQLEEIFPQRLYIELQNHTSDDGAQIAALMKLAGRLSLPTVATHDIYTIEESQANLQRLISAIRENCRLSDLPAGEAAPSGSSFLGASEMQRRFAEFPEALQATQEISERCQLVLPLGVAHFPEIPLPAGKTSDAVLREKAEIGASRLYGRITPEIRSRLDHELATIDELGYAALFLVMEEILDYARSQSIPFSSRGSAASSLVAHCLGITSPDPIKLNLYFERFLNPARHTPPDIDTDLCSRRRDKVIQFVYERYGRERVAMVCTINRFRGRSALREVAKAHGMDTAEISQLAAALPYRWYGPPWQSENKGSPYADLAERFHSPLHQRIFQDAGALIEIPHHLSIHPGGVVIAPGQLTDLAPTTLGLKRRGNYPIRPGFHRAVGAD